MGHNSRLKSKLNIKHRLLQVVIYEAFLCEIKDPEKNLSHRKTPSSNRYNSEFGAIDSLEEVNLILSWVFIEFLSYIFHIDVFKEKIALLKLSINTSV